MKKLLLLLTIFTGVSLQAQTQSLSFYIDNSQGAATQPLPSAYAFPNTSVGQPSSIEVSVVNTSAVTVQINAIYVGATAGSSVVNNNFNVTGIDNPTIAPGASKPFFVTFSPTSAGAFSGYLQVAIAGQNTQIAVSTLTGTGLSSSVVLTCTDTPTTSLCNGSTPIPASSSIQFGPSSGLAPGTTYTLSFTLTNNTAAAINKPSISSELYAGLAFTSSDLTALPAQIGPGTTVTFKIVFTPQATGTGASSPQTATLTVGSASYTLDGLELPATPSGNDLPVILCQYQQTSQPCTSTGSNIYSLGPTVNTLTALFVIENPNPSTQTSNSISLSGVPQISNATSFSVSNLILQPYASGFAGTPVKIAAGQAIPAIPAGWELTFNVGFTGSAAASGTLTFSYTDDLVNYTPLSYTLNAQPAPPPGGTGSDLPGITLMCGSTPCSSQTFSSQQQVQATLQVSSATTAGATLAISFKSLVSGVTDPAVTFIDPYTQTNLNFLFTTASLSGMLSNNQPQFTFQTGTTAGAINFTLTDSATLATTPLTAITIQPSKVVIESSTAVRSSPNLILTITGYDDTYSAGPLSFTFYDLNGKNLTPNPITVNATPQFQQYFLGSSNQAGGAFSLVVTFPTTGDVTQVGSVAATISNNVGAASVTTNFQ